VCQVGSFGDEHGDPDFLENLESEMGAFLVSCKAAYMAECPRGMNLRVPAEMAALIKMQCSAIDADLLEEFYNTCIIEGPTYVATKTALHSALKHFFSKYYATQSSHFSFNDLLRKLSLKKEIKIEEDPGGTRYVGIKLRDGALELQKDSAK
jgi:hypothetical protein